jgi:NAD(P)-dependent dehydrogenase (short-subunit alcohol dehydrogenase family)
MGWTPDRLPNLSGKTYAITGGNIGLGFEATKLLCSKGAKVVFTSRSEERGREAVAKIKATIPAAEVAFVVLDLADPTSIAKAAKALEEKCPRLDAVINNAGVMQPPEQRTVEGFELQMGTNHLGHFRLNALLLPHLEKSGGRIVPVSSIAHRMGQIELEDLNFKTRTYDPMAAYAQSKLANLMYGFELQRRLAAKGSRVTAISCHPGYAATNLQTAGVSMAGGSAFWAAIYKVTNALMAQTAEHGAYPLVLAAADPTAEPGAYYGPTAFQQTRGPVGKSFVDPRAKDERVAKALWEKTEGLVGPFFS